MKPVADNPYMMETSVQIMPGTYRYKYIVDSQWRYDPNDDVRANKYNTFDNLIQVFPAVYELNKEESDTDNQPIHTFEEKGLRVKIKTELTGDVRIKGSWDDWEKEIALPKTKAKIYMRLKPGIYR